ncbi:MAG: GIY-YIG nuclease family protein [Patescibacteria group bacterium]
MCDDGYLYVGITGNIKKRLSEYRNGLCRNTKNRGKTRLVYKEVFSSIHSAAAREKEIKGWRRTKKEALINRA